MSDLKMPPPCDHEIFQKGKSIVAIDGRSNDVEAWVQSVAKKADAKLDWHYSGGIANVLHLGDLESRQRAEEAITALEPTLKGRIMKRYALDEAGLYRKGVTETPNGAIAGFFDGEGTSFIVSNEE